MRINMKMKPNDKIEIIDALLGKVNAAIETMGGLIYSDSRKVILDFVSHIGLEKHFEVLGELKKAGAIGDFESSDDCFYITKPSKQRLLEERKRLVNFDQTQSLKRSSVHSSKNKGLIQKLEVVEPKAGNKFKIVVNHDYENPIHADKVKPSWDLLFRVAGENLTEADGHKSSLDYLNTNKGCRLYTKTGYQLTKILKVENGYILPAIEIKIITEKAFQQRANKSRKAT